MPRLMQERNRHRITSGIDMNGQLDDHVFRDFIRLRDALRAAKKEKNYQSVLSFGLSILELDTNAGFLKIATHVFLKDMAEACIKLNDIAAAVEYLIAAKDKLKIQQGNSSEWQKEIESINGRLDRLLPPRSQSIVP